MRNVPVYFRTCGSALARKSDVIDFKRVPVWQDDLHDDGTQSRDLMQGKSRHMEATQDMKGERVPSIMSVGLLGFMSL